MSLQKRFRDLTLQQTATNPQNGHQGNNSHQNTNYYKHTQIPPTEMEKFVTSKTILSDLLAENNYLRTVSIINQLPRAQLVDLLNQAKVTFLKGNLAVLRKRCKLYLQKRFDRKQNGYQKSTNTAFAKKPPRYCVVIDFEATCDKANTREAKDSYPHEIIEFPAIIVDLEAQNHEENQTYLDEDSGRIRSPTDLHVVDTFHRYVKPIQYPILTDYCTRLTGIKQEQVDTAEEFPEVLQAFHEFLMKNGLNPNTFRVLPTESNNMLKDLVDKEDELSTEDSDKHSEKITKEADSETKSDYSTNKSSNTNETVINGTENNKLEPKTSESDSKTTESTSKETSSSNQNQNKPSEFFQAKVEKWACVTDGPFDFSKFLRLQCETSGIKYPRWAAKWINVKRLYASFYSFPTGTKDETRRKGANARFMKLDEMLENVGLSFAGRKHSGIDDTKNIVRILIQIKTDGATPMLNEQFDSVAQQFYSAMMVPKKVRGQYGANTGGSAFRYNNPSGDSSGTNSGGWGDKNGRNTPNKDKTSKWSNSKVGSSSKKVEPQKSDMTPESQKTGSKVPVKPKSASDSKNQVKNEKTTTTKNDSTSKTDSSSKTGSKPNSRPGSRQSNLRNGKLPQSKLAEKVSDKPQQTSTSAKNTN